MTSESLAKSIRHAIQLHQEAERRKLTEEMLKKSHQELMVAHKELQTSLNNLKTAKNQILRSEKLAGIGRLAAGVCHEILNPLNIISGYSQTLQMERGKTRLCRRIWVPSPKNSPDRENHQWIIKILPKKRRRS